MSVAGVTAAATVGISIIARAAVPGFAAIDTRPAIEISLIAMGLLLVMAVQRVTQRDVRVSDLVVDVGPEASGEVATRIGAALGDPTLEIAFAEPGGDGFVDAAGRPLVLPTDDPTGPSPGSRAMVARLPRSSTLGVGIPTPACCPRSAARSSLLA